MAYASRLYPRAKPRGFTLQWIKHRIDWLFFLADTIQFAKICAITPTIL